MKRPYETMIIFDGTLPEDVIQKEQSAVEELLKKSSSFERVDVWGKRALAYPIRKKKTGHYSLFIYEGDGQAVSAIDKHVKLNEKVLRYMTVVRDLKNEAARAAAAQRRETAPPKETRETEEEE